MSPTSRSYIVRPLDGDNQIYDDIPADATVRDLKQQIFVRHGVQVQNQKLIYGPEVMIGTSQNPVPHHFLLRFWLDTRTLESYNIREVRVLRFTRAPNITVP
jgi:Ubiquitin family